MKYLPVVSPGHSGSLLSSLKNIVKVSNEITASGFRDDTAQVEMKVELESEPE